MTCRRSGQAQHLRHACGRQADRLAARSLDHGHAGRVRIGHHPRRHRRVEREEAAPPDRPRPRRPPRRPGSPAAPRRRSTRWPTRSGGSARQTMDEAGTARATTATLPKPPSTSSGRAGSAPRSSSARRSSASAVAASWKARNASGSRATCQASGSAAVDQAWFAGWRTGSNRPCQLPYRRASMSRISRPWRAASAAHTVLLPVPAPPRTKRSPRWPARTRRAPREQRLVDRGKPRPPSVAEVPRPGHQHRGARAARRARAPPRRASSRRAGRWRSRRRRAAPSGRPRTGRTRRTRRRRPVAPPRPGTGVPCPRRPGRRPRGSPGRSRGPRASRRGRAGSRSRRHPGRDARRGPCPGARHRWAGVTSCTSRRPDRRGGCRAR